MPRSVKLAENQITDMKSRLISHDVVISWLIILTVICTNLLIVSGDSDHCGEQKFKFARAFNTSFMQFTKEPVSQEYAIEGQFKNIHCCAKGYRSIEWFKDGKRYPWSSDDTSSLILYPQASNQTIYARHASLVDEGKYSCVLRNDTHRIEHHIQLKVLDSSPDVPLATFTPGNQFADVGGSARFFCEAFVGKTELPDISISIKWYFEREDNFDQQIDDEQQEIVKREDGQIIGSYLNLNEIRMRHYGRYLCRIEMGNSQTHRLEMSAELINALPIEAEINDILFNPIFLAVCAALLVLLLFFLVHLTGQWCRSHVISFNSNELEILNMKKKKAETGDVTSPKPKKPTTSRSNSHDDTKIMINSF